MGESPRHPAGGPAETGRRRGLLRGAVLALGAAETVAALLPVLSLLSSSEGLSRSIGLVLLAVAAVAFVLFVLPALVLGLLGRRLWLALALEALAVPGCWVVMAALAG